MIEHLELNDDQMHVKHVFTLMGKKKFLIDDNNEFFYVFRSQKDLCPLNQE